MVTKGIITSIDFNGNTCQVRIPLFETAGNDPITGTAIVSNTPGSYNGYKVGDVVLVAFEDGKMQNPVIVGKLYLGAAKEKQDPRGTINVETTTASKSASLPADAVLTANVDSNVPNTNAPFGSLASIANNLNSLNTDVNQLDKFTRNQFNSVITDVNDQGEQLRSEIRQNAESITAEVSRASEAEGELDSKITQTAENINAEVSRKYVAAENETTEQRGLGWNLNTEKWEIYAKDTVNNKVAKLPIMTVDRTGMSISGDLKLDGYPKNITVLYAQNDSDTKHPPLYKDNGEIGDSWSTTAPGRADGKYIWQWTHTESYSFDEANNSWNEKDDDKVVCITGADGAPGAAGYNTATVLLYKRKTKTGSVPSINWTNDLTYNFADRSLSPAVPSGWSTTISAPITDDDGLYVTTAVAYSNTSTDAISYNEWTTPTLYVENGKDGAPGKNGAPGVSIKENKQWYILKSKSFPGSGQKPEDIKPTNNTEPTYNPAPTSTTVDKWMSTPPEAVNGYVVWTCYGSIFSDDTSSKRHIEYSVPVKDNAYALAQGKTTNYYSDTDPSKVYSVKKGDCWFKTISSTDDDYNNERPDQNQGKLYQCSGFDANGKAIWEDIGGELVTNKLTANYINALDITAKKITVLDKGNNTLFNADGLSNDRSVSIGGFTVDSNRLYAGNPGTDNGIELASIGTNKASIKVGSNFSVDNTGAIKSTSGTIGCFTVSKDKLYSNSHSELNSTNPGVYLGTDGISIGSKFKVVADSVVISDYTKSINKKYRKTTFDVVPESAPEGWENWNYTEWSSELPVRENGKYIWEWTKEVKGNSTDDISTWEDKGKICITGAKGDPGANGKTPYIKDGNWWVDNIDTGIKAQGAQGAPGNTPYIKNGNWWIGDTDTGIKAEGTDGATGRSVSSVTKYYKLATSKPNPPDVKEPTDWYTSPPSFVKGNNYYESDRTIYDDKTFSWSEVIENSMLTVDFINSLGITAQGLKVVDSNKNTILSANIANETPNSVQIGGFTVDSDRLYAGTPGTDDSIELATSYNLVAYRSNNAKIDAYYEVAVGKIIVNKDIANLTVYIRSDGETTNDYTVISIPNVENYPTAALSSGVKAHTSGKQNSGQELGDYIPVNYSDLKQGDWIYVVYRKDGSGDYGADTGYILIPETTDIKLEAVDGVEWGFIRDSAFDIKGALKGASLKVGSNFSVYSTGAIRATSGTIGNINITADGLAYKSSSTSFKIGQESSDPRMPKYAIHAGAQRIDKCIMGLKSGSYEGATNWVEFKPEGYFTYMSNDNTTATITGKIPYEHMKHICWLNSGAGSHAYEGANATCPQIIVLKALDVTGGSYKEIDLTNYGYRFNEIIGVQITEEGSQTAGSTNQRFYIKMDENGNYIDKKIRIINTTSGTTKTYSLLVIAI